MEMFYQCELLCMTLSTFYFVLSCFISSTFLLLFETKSVSNVLFFSWGIMLFLSSFQSQFNLFPFFFHNISSKINYKNSESNYVLEYSLKSSHRFIIGKKFKIWSVKLQSQRNHFFQNEIWSGFSSVPGTESTRMAREQIELLKLATGRPLEKTGK